MTSRALSLTSLILLTACQPASATAQHMTAAGPEMDRLAKALVIPGQADSDLLLTQSESKAQASNHRGACDCPDELAPFHFGSFSQRTHPCSEARGRFAWSLRGLCPDRTNRGN
jgi:hypothetical protein